MPYNIRDPIEVCILDFWVNPQPSVLGWSVKIYGMPKKLPPKHMLEAHLFICINSNPGEESQSKTNIYNEKTNGMRVIKSETG